MKFSKLFCSLAILGGVAASFAAGNYVGKIQPRSNEPVMPKKVENSGQTQNDIVLQDGKPVSLSELMAGYQTNPNRFRSMTEKSKFRVEGEIQKVGDSSSADTISGFYIPLKYSSDDVSRTVASMRGQRVFPLPVSLFVRGLESAQIAAFNPNQSIKADCPRIRVVMDGFVFDDCTILKDASK